MAAIGFTAANREIFSPSHARAYPLQKLGIKSYLPSIRGYISVPQAIVEKMNLHITSFAHRLTPGKRKNLAAQDRAELTHVIWNSNKAMQWPAICHDDHDWLHADISNSLQYKQSEMQTFMLACPTCSFCQDVSRCRLWMGRVWNCLRCQQCGQRSSSSRWQCACGAPWSTCLTHRQQGFACGGESRKTKSLLTPKPKGWRKNAKRRKATSSMNGRCRGLKALKPQPPKRSWLELEAPRTAINLSWLQRRPLKPGSVAWLVAMRQATSGQRQLDMQAVPAADHAVSLDANTVQ